MSADRRRNLFILLAVFGLLAVSLAVISTKETKLGLDLQGGVSLIYEGKPTKQQPTLTADSMQRAVDIIRERVDALGVAEPEIARTGQDQIEVSLPAVENAKRAEEQVGTVAQMAFYDWEPNILDADCVADPNENANSKQPVVGFRAAVERASKCKAEVDENNTNASAERWYGFNRAGQPINAARGAKNGSPTATEAELKAPDVERADGKTNPQPGDEYIQVPEGILIVRQERGTDQQGRPNATEPDVWWVIKDNPVLAGTDIKNPEQNYDQQSNEPIVTMEFTERGKAAFAKTTSDIAIRGQDNAVGLGNSAQQSHHFAIVLDNELVSTPYIDYGQNPDGIDGETGAQISGGFSVQSAQDLAKFLKIGALPIDLELISRSQVSATLGKQALDQGLTAGIAGFIIVAVFLLLFYRVAGVIAVVALGIYGVYFYALVKLIPITLTLPGIAGLILTLGVAADANIVIFERVKEEIRKGRSVAAGIAEGYRKGFSSIIDANIVTLLVAFILFILATAGVKGFAFTLGVGTIVSLFTAVLATQAILLSLRGTRVVRSRSALGAGKDKRPIRFDFMGASRLFFSMSGVILMIGALAIAGKGLNFGIDFESGTRIKAPLAQAASVEQVRTVLEGLGYEAAKVQTVDDPEIGRNVVQISTEQLRPADVDRVEDALDQRFGFQTGEQPSSESIGPTFGASVAKSALIAIIASLTVISVYLALRFEWKYAVPVLIALSHDILITGGVYAMVGREVTTSTVAALLTILGFSLYDTIIVFDRIRENVPRMPSAAFTQIVNRSMSEVIVRSMATSFCTALPVIGLWLFGGETLKDFAFALIIGTLSGTYSSVFIAGPVLSHWKSREAKYRAREERITAQHGHVPAYADQSADVAPAESRRAPVRLTADPSQGVSQEEFQDLVANLGVENKPAVAPPRQRPAGGRRAKGNGTATKPAPPPAAGPEGTDDGGKEGSGPKKKPRNTRHGRPR